MVTGNAIYGHRVEREPSLLKISCSVAKGVIQKIKSFKMIKKNMEINNIGE